MKTKSFKVECRADNPSIIEVDGQKYICEREKLKKIDGVVHGDKLIFKKFDEKEYKENLKTIIDALSKQTTTVELLTHILKDLDMKTLRRLAKRIKGKKKVRKQHGCLGFKIGDSYVELVS